MHQKYKNFGQVTEGRLFVNKELMPRFVDKTPDGSDVLFIGAHLYWDYSCYFNNPGKLCNFKTLDKHPGGGKQPVPDYQVRIENCKEKIEDNSFDRVIMIGVYEFIDKKKEAFSEINRILKPKGRALISVLGRGHYSDDRALDPWEVWEKLKPLRILETYTTYEKSQLDHLPTSVHIIAEKHE